MSDNVVPFQTRKSGDREELLDLLDRLADRVKRGEIEGIAVGFTYSGGGGGTEWVSSGGRMPDLIAVSVLLQTRITMAVIERGGRT